MHLTRRRLLALALGTLVGLAGSGRARASRALRVGVLRSAASLGVSGWVGAWETDGSIRALRALGLDVRVMYDADLERGELGNIDVLVVPSARCVGRRGAAKVREWVNGGGRLLATGMAAYRDERNRRVTADNDFQWADLYGASFQRWLGAWPHCEYLDLDAHLAAEVGAVMRGPAVRRIQLGRNTAMLVRAQPGTEVLATWVQADGVTPTTDSGSASAAIVQRDRVIYCGENLLAPELSRSPQVIALVLALLRRLYPEGPTRLPDSLLQPPGPLALPAGPSVDVTPGGDLLRVGIHSSLGRAGVASKGGVRVRSDAETWTFARGQLVEVAPGPENTLVLQATGRTIPVAGALTIEPVERVEPLQFLQLRPNGACRVQGFRGALEVRRQGEAMAVVNLVSAEEYTAGVVPNETPAVYPDAALQAMAVIARTFGLSRRGYHKSRGYDVCNTVDCQMYGGWFTEWDKANRAVNATREQVIMAGEALADSTFHAVCGGVGENVERVWPQPPAPYLVGAPDGPAALPDLSSDEAFRAFIEHPPDSYCSASPRFRWRETYTLPQLQALFDKSLPVTLGAPAPRLGTLRAMRVLERSPLGRVLKLQIEGSDGTCVVEKDRIRWLWSAGQVGQGGLQSTLFHIVTRPDGVVELVGGGWGHGVGMCQEGAAGMATRGLDYRAIIRHYYPNTSIAPRPDGAPPPKILEVERK